MPPKPGGSLDPPDNARKDPRTNETPTGDLAGTGGGFEDQLPADLNIHYNRSSWTRHPARWARHLTMTLIIVILVGGELSEAMSAIGKFLRLWWFVGATHNVLGSPHRLASLR